MNLRRLWWVLLREAAFSILMHEPGLVHAAALRNTLARSDPSRIQAAVASHRLVCVVCLQRAAEQLHRSPPTR